MGSLYPNVINVRPYNVFGEGQLAESKAVIPLFINNILNHKNSIIYGDGHQTRDFTYVCDLVEELKRIMFEEHNPQRQVWHCGYSKPISIHELFMKLQFIIGEGNSKVEYKEERSYDVKTSTSPNTIPEYFGRDEGLVRTCIWWKENRALPQTSNEFE